MEPGAVTTFWLQRHRYFFRSWRFTTKLRFTTVTTSDSSNCPDISESSPSQTLHFLFASSSSKTLSIVGRCGCGLGPLGEGGPSPSFAHDPSSATESALGLGSLLSPASGTLQPFGPSFFSFALNDEPIRTGLARRVGRGVTFEELCQRFEKSAPAFVKELREKRPNYLFFLNYPDGVRRTLSTTNAVEAINKQLEILRRNSGGYFHSEETAKLKLGIAVSSLESGRWRRVAANVTAALDQFNAMFEARFETE